MRDSIKIKLMMLLTVAIIILFFFIFFLLVFKSFGIFKEASIVEILFSSTWNPGKGDFGMLAIIIGTILVTGISLLISVPISLLSAIYISEYANGFFRKALRPFLDVLAGVPSVVYGLCAFIFLVPIVRKIAAFFGVQSTGMCILTASIILAVMVFPIIISLCVDSLMAVPVELREASLSIGATKWETVKKVVLKASAPNIISAVLLGFGRAFGETIAVNMVVGGIPRIPSSLFQPGQTLASLIASAYGELMSIPLYQSALMMVALILFSSVLVFNLASALLVRHANRRWMR